MDTRAMREVVFRHKETFGKIVTVWGDRTWREYYTQDFPLLRAPSTAVVDAIEHETALILNSHAAGKAARRAVLQKQWVSTADHHGLLCHPYFYSSNLVQSDEHVRKGEETLVTLAFGNISLSNDSFPRGFFFHDQTFEPVRFLFKSLKDRNLPVCVLPPIQIDVFLRECERMRSVGLSPESRSRLYAFLDMVRVTPDVWNQDTYSGQLTVLNHVLWRSLFGNDRGSLTYLEIDTVVRRLLLEIHLKSETNIFRILFSPAWRKAFIDLFEGVAGSHTNGTGTHLFWYVDYERNKRRGLFVKDDTLRTFEGDVVLPLIPDSIEEALYARKIIPGTALLLLTIHAEEKLTCAGGVSQLDYLKKMMEKWNELLFTFGVGATEPTNTTILSGEQVLFQIVGQGGCANVASLFDLLLYEASPHTAVTEALGIIQIKDTIDAMIPSLYKMLTQERVSQTVPTSLYPIRHF